MDKIIVVTGGSRGIGAATARLAAQQGYAVALSYLRSGEAAQALVEEIEKAGGRAVAIASDVAQEGIRVNGVRPGFIYTEMHASGGEPGRVDRVKTAVPMQRGGEAGEVAAAILWLLSDEASYTTGAILDVSGGR